MCAPSCTWPSARPRSAAAEFADEISAALAWGTDSTWRACCPAPAAPSASTPSRGCGRPRTHGPARPLSLRAAAEAATFGRGCRRIRGRNRARREAQPPARPGPVLRVAAASADPARRSALRHRVGWPAARRGRRRRGRARRCMTGRWDVGRTDCGDDDRGAGPHGSRAQSLPERDAIGDLPPRDVSAQLDGRPSRRETRRRAAPLPRTSPSRPAGARRPAARHRQGPRA